jgi:hypothetical protein
MVASKERIGLETEFTGQRGQSFADVRGVADSAFEQSLSIHPMSHQLLCRLVVLTSRKNWASKVLGVESKGDPYCVMSHSKCSLSR